MAKGQPIQGDVAGPGSSDRHQGRQPGHHQIEGVGGNIPGTFTRNIPGTFSTWNIPGTLSTWNIPGTFTRNIPGTFTRITTDVGIQVQLCSVGIVEVLPRGVKLRENILDVKEVETLPPSRLLATTAA